MAAVPAPIAGRRSGGRTTQLLFRGFLVLSLVVGFATLAALLIDVLRDGLPYLTTQLFTDPPSSSPEFAGARPAIIATIYLMVLLILFTVPIGVGTDDRPEARPEQSRRAPWAAAILERGDRSVRGRDSGGGRR